jgi:hypothetical protein
MLFKKLTFAVCILAATFAKGTLAKKENPAPCGAPFCGGAADMYALTDDGSSTLTPTAMAALALRV